MIEEKLDKLVKQNKINSNELKELEELNTFLIKMQTIIKINDYYFTCPKILLPKEEWLIFDPKDPE